MSEATAIAPSGLLDCALVSEQQFMEQRSWRQQCLSIVFNSLSRSFLCTAHARREGWEGGALTGEGVCIFVTFAQSTTFESIVLQFAWFTELSWLGTAFAETTNYCRIIRLGKSSLWPVESKQLVWVELNCGKLFTIDAPISKLIGSTNEVRLRFDVCPRP